MLADFALACTSLTHLGLQGCGIASESGGALRSILQVSSDSLTTLNLAGNDMGPAWAQGLGPSLAACSKIRTINLSHNGLGIEGIVHVMTAVRRSTTLTSLDLSFNGKPASASEDKSVIAAVMSLQHCTNLIELHLFGGLPWKSVTEAGTQRLVRCLAALTPPTENISPYIGPPKEISIQGNTSLVTAHGQIRGA